MDLNYKSVERHTLEKILPFTNFPFRVKVNDISAAWKLNSLTPENIQNIIHAKRLKFRIGKTQTKGELKNNGF